MDAIAAELGDAGLLTIGTDAESTVTWTLTHRGEQVARQMSVSSEDDALELLAALLDVTRAGTAEA
jgi:hypothetical protein